MSIIRRTGASSVRLTVHWPPTKRIESRDRNPTPPSALSYFSPDWSSLPRPCIRIPCCARLSCPRSSLNTRHRACSHSVRCTARHSSPRCMRTLFASKRMRSGNSRGLLVLLLLVTHTGVVTICIELETLAVGTANLSGFLRKGTRIADFSYALGIVSRMVRLSP